MDVKKTLFEATLSERRWPSRPAIIIPDTGPVITYTELRRQIRHAGDVLVDAGVRPGHNLAMLLHNSLEFVVSFLAVACLGGIAAPLIPDYSVDECFFYLHNGEAKGIIVAPNQGTNARKAARRLHLPIFEVSLVRGKVVYEHIPHFPTPEEEAEESEGKGQSPIIHNSQAQSSYNTASGFDSDVIHWTGDPPKPGFPVLLLYTSGTTSKPKGCSLTHQNLVASLTNIKNTYALKDIDVSYVVMPLFHVHGLMSSLLATLTSGGTCVIPPKFSATHFWPQFNKYKCTWYSAVPTIHQILLLNPKTFTGAPTLRFIRSCSSSLPPQTLQDMEKLFKVPVVEAYAMTEASHQMCANPLPPLPHKPGSVGKGTGVDVQILDERGQPVPQGELGEICIKGPNVMTMGYLKRPEATREAFHSNGFFRTGDQGHLDSDGYLFITGRLKELINRGGEKISPIEVDDILLQYPEVNAAVCFGVPDKIYGEEIHAAVVMNKHETNEIKLRELESKILEYCKKRLVQFKCPKVIYVTEGIPRTATGKIQRREVASHFLKVAAENAEKLKMLREHPIELPVRTVRSKL